ncbi:MAG: hypothetical protein M1375_04175 [Candidatus Thermoplasmatota archaeon]|jgi:Mg2+/Co2+ transporter CorC|nr:hypothetical protein [Candidatus Thermoplasmatota archaeon]MCL5791152.1 hypothetical protein [Candidatus Thermoplasmatota archaeon]
MQEMICNIELSKEDDEKENGENYIAKLRTEMGGLREYSGVTFEDVLNQVIIELEEEFS